MVAAGFGVMKGYVQLNLGVLVNFEDMRANFHQAARHYAQSMRARPGTGGTSGSLAQRCAR